MKRIFLLFIYLSFVPALYAQTLFTYGGIPVDKEEFLRAYNKNKVTVADKEKSLREYLDLYTRFKLKVKAATDIRMDTLQQLLYDLQNFRSQVDESYMNNEKAMNQLVNETFERSGKDIHVLHFYAGIDAKMAPADTAKAYLAMKELQDKLKPGSVNYEELVKDLSKKYLPVRQSDIGFITAFSLPYAYENIIYGLKAGEASAPYRSKNGLHVFKVLEERKSMGKWRIAQILLAYPPGDQSEQVTALQHKADSVYAALKRGEDFMNLAKRVSDDKLTYMSGGEMPEFGTGKFELSFEKEVLKLTRDGEVGKPFASAFGFHILKRLSQTNTPVVKDANYLYELKQKIQQDSRIAGIKEKFVTEIIPKTGYKKITRVSNAELYRFADSAVVTDADLPVKKYPVSDKVIISFTKSNLKGSDWLNFVREYKNNPSVYKGEDNAALMAKFISTSVLDYYKKHLEEYDAEFRYQMDEFKEGNLLFEIMEKRVWGSASNDSAGLQKQYNEHKNNYLWGPSASVLLFNCSSSAISSQCITEIKTGKPWKKIVAEGNNNIQADSGRYEISQLPLPAGIKAEAGIITEPLINSVDGTVSFIKILSLYENGLQRSFEDARGLVINDYQNILEEKWIEELKKKYPVKVNESVFISLLK